MSLLKEFFFEDGCLHGCFYGCFPCNSAVFSNINGLCNFLQILVLACLIFQ